MINRSTTMFLAACALLAPVNGASLTAGAGVYSNEDNAKALFSAAVPFSGNYKISNAASGATLTYMHNSQPNIWPAQDPLEELIKMVEGIEDSAVSQTFGLEADSDNAVRIRFNDGDKCLSSEWSMDYGVDLYGAAYECAVGAGAQSDTGLRNAKQWFLLVPAEGSSSSSSGSSSGSGSQTGSETGSGSSSGLGSSGDNSSPKSSPSSSASSSSGTGIPCEKSPYWVYSHPVDQHKDFYDVHPECVGTAKPYPCDHDSTWLHAHSGYLEDHPWCQATYDAGSKRDLSQGQRMVQHRRMAAQKRGAQTFRIHLTDHIDDMQSRCVTSAKTTAFNDMMAAGIGLCDDSDDSQLWTFAEV